MIYFSCWLALVPIDCESPFDTEISHSGAEIISPNYPNTYDEIYGETKHCEITVRFVGRVRITFLDFNLGFHKTDCCMSHECRNVYLKLFDGNNSSSEQIGPTMCGYSGRKYIESTGNALHILFHSEYPSWRFRLLIQDSGKNGI